MKHISKIFLFGTCASLVLASCTKNRDLGILNQGNYTDTTGPLKSAGTLAVGTAIDYTPMLTDANYAAIVKRDFNAVTFGYQMKHGAIVQNDGSYDYSKADALVNACSGLTIYGHVLGWYQNQNATYLKSYTGVTQASPIQLLTNSTFETGGAGWNIYNTNGATVTFVTGSTTNAHAGSGFMQVVNPTAQTGAQYKVQVASDLITTVVGQSYTFSYFVKGASAGGSIRLSVTDQTGGNAQYQGDQTIPTTYQQISYTFTAKSTQTRLYFDMGQAANTYYIDDASFTLVVVAPSGPQIALKVDTALKTFVTNMVTHYKTNVHAWDVINEVLADNGTLRTNANSITTSPAPTDVFVWSEYLGRNFPLNAFKYAQAADPTALLFINDYNLESATTTKLDSLINLVTWLKANGAKVDGIGTQMHIAWNTSYNAIDLMMQKLAATGLLVRVSELDVKANPLNKAGFVLTQLSATYQADMYKYVIQSYLKYIPKAQQYLMTFWGVTDNTSWLYNNGQDFPDLYNANYTKKQAYSASLQALKGL